MSQKMFVLRSPGEKQHIQRVLFSSDIFKDNLVKTCENGYLCYDAIFRGFPGVTVLC